MNNLGIGNVTIENKKELKKLRKSYEKLLKENKKIKNHKWKEVSKAKLEKHKKVK